MPNFLDWEIKCPNNNSKIYESDKDLIVVSNNQIQATIAQQPANESSPLLKITSGDITFVISQEFKKINVFCE